MQALKRYQENNFVSSSEVCLHLLRESQNVKYYELLAKNYVALEEYERAEYYLIETLNRKKVSSPSLRYLLAKVLMKQRKFDDAEMELTRARIQYQGLSGNNSEYSPLLIDLSNCSRYRGNNIGSKLYLEKDLENGYAQVHLAFLTYYLQSEDFYNLEQYYNGISDSIRVFIKSDSVNKQYLENIEKILHGSYGQINLKKINNLIEAKNENIGFDGVVYDHLWLKYKVNMLNADTLDAYHAFKEYVSYNDKNSKAKEELMVFKRMLDMDTEPPTIEILNPTLNEFKSALHEDDQDFLVIYGRVLDNVKVAELWINDEPIYQVEEGGIFRTEQELHEGSNEFVMYAKDSEGNVSSDFKFNIKYNKHGSDLQNTTLVNIAETEIPVIAKSVTNHVILIAENDYQDKQFASLKNPIKDATELKHILTGKYEFNAENVIELYNVKKDLLTIKLSEIFDKMGPNDNVLIFYAGHGEVKYIDNEIKGGYIIPVDATHSSQSTYISSRELLASINECQARNILFIVDACFGGALFRSASTDSEPSYIRRYKTQKSRWVLTSGNIEAVPDGGTFIKDVTSFLSTNNEKYFLARDLFTYIEKNAKGTVQPTFERILNTGDTGGMFIFFAK